MRFMRAQKAMSANSSDRHLRNRDTLRTSRCFEKIVSLWIHGAREHPRESEKKQEICFKFKFTYACFCGPGIYATMHGTSPESNTENTMDGTNLSDTPRKSPASLKPKPFACGAGANAAKFAGLESASAGPEYEGSESLRRLYSRSDILKNVWVHSKLTLCPSRKKKSFERMLHKSIFPREMQKLCDASIEHESWIDTVPMPYPDLQNPWAGSLDFSQGRPLRVLPAWNGSQSRNWKEN